MWSSDWRIDSLATTLTALQDGFSGSLAIVDPSGIVLSSSSGLSVAPALTCGDAFIQDAAQQVHTLCIPPSVPPSVLMPAQCASAFGQCDMRSLPLLFLRTFRALGAKRELKNRRREIERR